MGSPPALACKFFLKTGKFGLFPLNFSITPAAHQQPHAIVPAPYHLSKSISKWRLLHLLYVYLLYIYYIFTCKSH